MIRNQPGAGQQAGPDVLTTPSHAHTAGRLLADETLPSRRRPPRVSHALLALALAASAAACAKPAQPPALERPPAPVRVAAAVAHEVPVYLDEIGRAVAKETVWVKAQVGGRIESVHFEDGADLHKGDVLFTLDVRPFQARLDAAEAALMRARAVLERAHTATARPQAALERAHAAHDLALAELARVEALVASKAVSQSDYDEKKSAAAVTAAEVAQAEADLKQSLPDERQAEADVKKAEADAATARLDVEYATLRSPIDGRAGRRLVDAGNVIEANGDPLVMVERLDPVYVDFTVPESDLTVVQTSMRKGTLRVEVRLPDEPGDPRAGELTFLDNAVQQGSGTVTLRATVPNEDHRFWPGRFVRARLVLETLPAAVLVPAEAPQVSAKGTFVYVVKDDSTAEMRPVTLGQRHDGLVVVTQGVRPGERVVVTGHLAVTPGGKVRVESEPTTTANAAGAK